ncbi:MAG: hypothetical protein R3202_02400 [Candidatus Competibacterales bacterium]|nr:hypothetical protein [Candidatus Competibacterales bacterium]
MTAEPSPQQVLYLWSLLVAGGEGFVKDQPYQPDARERRALLRSGLIEEEKRHHPRTRRPVNFNTVTDAGWAWIAAHMEAPLPPPSKGERQVLQALLAQLGAFLQARDLPLAEFLAPGSADPGPQADLEQRLLEACLELGDGRRDVRVRLADLRERLADVERATLDRELFRLQRERRLVLYPLDDPLEITRADQAAAIDIGGVGKRHILYLRG